MNKVSFRMRMTILTAICLSIACIAMFISSAWLADSEIINTISMGSTIQPDFSSDYEEFNMNYSDGILINDDTNAAYINLAESGLKEFRIKVLLIMLVIIIVGALLAWIIAGVVIMPINNLSQQIEKVNERKMTVTPKKNTYGKELDNLWNSYQKMLFRLQQAFEREKRFSAAAAHELKTPLTIMRSGIDVLELSENPTIEEYKETIEELKGQVIRLNDLIFDLLSYAKTRKVEMNDKIEVNCMVELLLDELAFQYPNLIIKKDIVSVSVISNKNFLEKSIFNLLDNAAKYNTHSGYILVSLRPEDDYWIFSVQDSGIGISQDAAEHIFEPFFQEDASRSSKKAGVGLGLAFVKEFVEMSGGKVSYTKAQPHGSVFEIKLPYHNI